MLVLRELMLGPRRFSELKADLPGISANVLTQRLDELEAARAWPASRLPPPASVQVYEATPWGLEAEPIVQALGRWAARSPRHDPTLPISARLDPAVVPHHDRRGAAARHRRADRLPLRRRAAMSLGCMTARSRLRAA